MLLNILPSTQDIKISQDGPCQRLVDPMLVLKNQTEIKLTIPVLHLVAKLHQKIEKELPVISAQVIGFMLVSKELSRISCKVVFQ